jgi:hypothetical protein
MGDAISFRASQQAQERLELLLDLTNRVVSSLNLRDVLSEISANIRRVMDRDGVGITPPSSEDGKLRIYAPRFPGQSRHKKPIGTKKKSHARERRRRWHSPMTSPVSVSSAADRVVVPFRS